LNFSDNNCRAVINVGIPFPPCKDDVVRAKQEYNSSPQARERGLLDGRAWYVVGVGLFVFSHSPRYEVVAFRALNQGLGRCIRHQHDWAAVILLDERFWQERYTRQLPLWVRQNMDRCPTWESGIRGLTDFMTQQRMCGIFLHFFGLVTS
jgi:Rad3-related DNA helicase